MPKMPELKLLKLRVQQMRMHLARKPGRANVAGLARVRRKAGAWLLGSGHDRSLPRTIAVPVARRYSSRPRHARGILRRFRVQEFRV